MLDLQQGLAGNHGNSSDPVVGLQMNDSRENSGAINLVSDVRRTRRNCENFGDPVGGGMPQFRLQTQGEGGDGDGDESGVSSPPLWKASPPGTPTEASPLNPHQHHQHRQQHQHHHHHHQRLPPTSRLQAITRGRQEMMEMVRSMPESSYELSLKDLVEQPKMKAIQQEPQVVDRNPSNNSTDGSEKGKKKNKKTNEKPKMRRSGSMDNEAFLLKMFFPTLGQKKKKNSTTGPCAKVSPRPSLEGSEKSADKEWWKKRFSSAGEGEKGRTESINGSAGSSSSTSSIRSRHMSGCLPGCWSFLFSKKRKAT